MSGKGLRGLQGDRIYEVVMGWSAESEVDPLVMMMMNALDDPIICCQQFCTFRLPLDDISVWFGRREDKRTRGQGNIGDSNKAVIGTECR